eukprot:Gb_03164 [translate_table: standard]
MLALNIRGFSAAAQEGPLPVKPCATSSKVVWKKVCNQTGQFQHTISRPVMKTGKGLHSGEEAAVRLLPAMAGQGRYFIVDKHQIRVPASTKLVTETALSTRIGRDGTNVGTIEHLLSALEGMGVDNCRIEIEGGNEVPLLDGSSMVWVEAIEEAGICIAKDDSGNNMEKMALVLCEPVQVFKDDSFVAAFPAPATRITYGIDFSQACKIII